MFSGSLTEIQLELLMCTADNLTTIICRIFRNPGSPNVVETKGLEWDNLTWLPVNLQNSELQFVLYGKLLVCGTLRAAVQRNSLQSYPTVIIELCNIIYILGVLQ